MEIIVKNSNGSSHAIIFNGDTLLDSMSHHGIEHEFHCKEGYCGACRITKLSGNVEYTEQPIAFLREDEILPCCCKPTSDLTVII
jgi:ferredoxin